MKVRINVYGIMQQYYDAVNLALESNDPELQELAIKWASKSGNENLRKKLWLKIAKHYLTFSDEKVIELLQHEDCPIKIADIISFFDDDQKIGSFRPLIEDSLREYNKKIEDYNLKLGKYEKISEFLKRKNQALGKKFYAVEFDRKCDVCARNVFTDVFYYFNCAHVFHRACLKQKFEEYGLEERLMNIYIAEKEIEHLTGKANIRLSSKFNREPRRVRQRRAAAERLPLQGRPRNLQRVQRELTRRSWTRASGTSASSAASWPSTGPTGSLPSIRRSSSWINSKFICILPNSSGSQRQAPLICVALQAAMFALRLPPWLSYKGLVGCCWLTPVGIKWHNQVGEELL